MENSKAFFLDHCPLVRHSAALSRLDAAVGFRCDPLSVDSDPVSVNGTAEMRLQLGSSTGCP